MIGTAASEQTISRAYAEHALRERGCAAHAEHRPRCASVDLHHVWPVGMGGPDVPSNWVILCPTGHRNVHRLLAAYVRLGYTPSWDVRQRYHPAERELAWQGYTAQLVARVDAERAARQADTGAH